MDQLEGRNRACDTDKKCRNGPGNQLVAQGVDSHCLSLFLVIPDGIDRRPKAGGVKPAEEHEQANPKPGIKVIDQHLEACDGTYISTHGSSILESFHLYLQGFLEGYSIGIVSLHFICVDLVYRWNLNRGKKLNRMDCLAIYDPQLLTDVVKLCTNLQVPVPHCFSMWKPFEKQWEGGCPAQNAKEMFGALRAHYHEIWYEEACRYYEKFPEQVSDDDIEFYPHQRGFSSLYEKFRLYTPVLPKPIAGKEEKQMYMYLLHALMVRPVAWPIGMTSIYTMVSLSIEDEKMLNIMKHMTATEYKKIAQSWCKHHLEARAKDDPTMSINFPTHQGIGTKIFRTSEVFLKSEQHI